MRPLQLTSCLLAVPAAMAAASRTLARASWLGYTFPALLASSLIYHGPGRDSPLVRAADMTLAHAVVAQHLRACVVCTSGGAWAIYAATAYGAASFWIVRKLWPAGGNALHGVMHAVMAAGSVCFMWQLDTC